MEPDLGDGGRGERGWFPAALDLDLDLSSRLSLNCLATSVSCDDGTQ